MDDDDSVRSKIDPLLSALGQNGAAPPFDLAVISSTNRKPVKSSSIARTRNTTIAYSDDKPAATAEYTNNNPKAPGSIQQPQTTTPKPDQTYYPPLPVTVRGKLKTTSPLPVASPTKSQKAKIKISQPLATTKNAEPTNYSHQTSGRGTSLSNKGQKGKIKISQANETSYTAGSTSAVASSGYSASSIRAVKGHPHSSLLKGELVTYVTSTRKPIRHNQIDPLMPASTTHSNTLRGHQDIAKLPKLAKHAQPTTTSKKQVKPIAIQIGADEYKIPTTKKPKKKKRPSQQSLAQWIIGQVKSQQEKNKETKLPSAVIWVCKLVTKY